MSFNPLSTLSPDAQALQEKYLASIRARVETGDCPPGLRKQYKLQLERIKTQAPSHEVVLAQMLGFWMRKRDSLSHQPSSPHLHQQLPSLKGNIQASCLF